MIDSGLANPQKIRDNIKKLSLEPNRIAHHIITHCHIDRIGNSAKLKRMLGFKVYAYVPDSQVIESGGIQTGAALYGVNYEPVKVDVKLITSEELVSAGKHFLLRERSPNVEKGTGWPLWLNVSELLKSA
jgi:glyoxylase-like metal-dependent hydrolase (beta-lactamase superfamily II)